MIVAPAAYARLVLIAVATVYSAIPPFLPMTRTTPGADANTDNPSFTSIVGCVFHAVPLNDASTAPSPSA